MLSWEVCLSVAISMIVGYHLPNLAFWSLRRRQDWAELSQIKNLNRMIMNHHLFMMLRMITMSISGIATFLVREKWSGLLEWMVALLFVWILLILVLTDCLTKLILNLFTYSGTILFAFLRFWIDKEIFVQYVVTALMMGFGLFLLARLTKGLGYGDVAMMVMGSMVVGPMVFFSFWLGTISASCYIVGRWICQQPIPRKEPFPFGPHLAIGLYLTYLWGEELFEQWLMISSLL
jgi:prepilin signal peptidase PulO-like enzyme (type II secretory pathway)